MLETARKFEQVCLPRRDYQARADISAECGHSTDTENLADKAVAGCFHGTRMNTGEELAAPQGFEPRYADPEAT